MIPTIVLLYDMLIQYSSTVTEKNITAGHQTFALQIASMSDHNSDICNVLAIKRKGMKPKEYSLSVWFMACTC